MPFTLLYKGPQARGESWQRAVASALPDATWCTWPDIPAPENVDAIIAWTLPDNALETYPNVKAIFSVGAGVDQLQPDKIPDSIKLVRLIDPSLTQQMQTYVLSSVMMIHRDHFLYQTQKAQKTWQQHKVALPHECTISILGLGELGKAVASQLSALGFNVNGWSRSAKQLDGVSTFHGQQGLQDMLALTDILVSLLPLTDETKGMINADTLAQLPQGASVINAGRGEQIVDEDLLAALDSGHIQYAILDVFKHEPLSESHPYWTHPRVHITPHIASITRNDTAGDRLAENLLRWHQGEPMMGEVDKQRGY